MHTIYKNDKAQSHASRLGHAGHRGFPISINSDDSRRQKLAKNFIAPERMANTADVVRISARLNLNPYPLSL